jgi:anti-sigma factor RsiW
MNIDESTLRAYVDSELPREQRDQVEAALANSASLQQQVAALRASCLPYRAAFEQQDLPPMPDSLVRHLASLTAVADAPRPVSAPGQMTRRRWAGAGLALAASFAGGLVMPTPWRRAAPAEPGVAAWIDAVAKYQAMYVRDTVEHTLDDPVRARAVLAGFSAQLPQPVAVPDLRDAGLAFKRVQRLGFGARPLLQMVFLPAAGKPAALCVLPTPDADAPLNVRQLEGLSVAAWQKKGLAYVFAADMTLAQATIIAEKLTADQYPALLKANA